jgi:copper chaperone CopZ
MLFSKKQIVKIDGMHCEHCAKRVEECLSSIPEVKKVKVNLNKKEAAITASQEIDLKAIKESLKETDFKVIE